MATLAERAQVAQNVTFQYRCLIARILVALDILNNSALYETGYVSFARSVLMSPMEFPYRATAVVITNGAIVDAEIAVAGSAPDADIQQTIRDNWQHFG